MPTLDISYKDLCAIADKRFNTEELMELLPQVKCEVEEWHNDTITVEVTPDRADLYSVEGIARAIATHVGQTRTYSAEPPKDTMTIEQVTARPYIACAVIENIKLTDTIIQSFMQLQETLHATFGRNRATMAIGLHDYDALQPPLAYSSGDPAKTAMVPLGEEQKKSLQDIVTEQPKGQAYGHLISSHKHYPIIRDANDTVISFPPIINSAWTEVTAKTQNIFIDVTGTDPKTVNSALHILVIACADRGGSIRQIKNAGTWNGVTPDMAREQYTLGIDYINEVTGMELTQNQIQHALEHMNYQVSSQQKKKQLTVQPPCYRSDILHPIDVIEDCVMAIGLNTITTQLPYIASMGQEASHEAFAETVRDVWIGFGYQEVSNPMLSNTTDLFENLSRPKTESLRIHNPVSGSYTHVRDRLLPQLLVLLANNTHTAYPQKVFECADIVAHTADAPEKSITKRHIAGMTAANHSSFNTIKGEIQGFCAALGLELECTAQDTPYFITGRGAQLTVNGTSIGELGEIHPQVLQKYGMHMPCVAFEIDATVLQQLTKS